MAWRITDSVIRGELDNRLKGTVTGRLWLNGLAAPVELRLKGNALADLAGCLIKFENIEPTIPIELEARFNELQAGTTGDLTASRKVRVPDVPFEEFYALRKAGKPAPEHLGNCLYLEWFSDANGRVVIEGIDWRTEISSAQWHLTAADEEQRAREAADGFAGFMNKLSAAIESKRTQPSEDGEWDEFDYERLMKESDANTDKEMELLDRHGESDNAEEKIAEEMGWNHREGSAIPGIEDDDSSDLDENNRACVEAAADLSQPDPATEGKDWIRVSTGPAEDFRHPLQHRCLEAAMRLGHECDGLQLCKPPRTDADVVKLIEEYRITSVKLAGALNGLVYGCGNKDGAFVVASLKRALSHLNLAQAALEVVAAKKVLPASSVSRERQEMLGIREEALRLMNEFRGRP